MANEKTSTVVAPNVADLPKGIVPKEHETTGVVKFSANPVADGELFSLKIGDIVEVKRTSIPFAAEIQRGLIEKNLESLFHAKDTDVPPIDVTNTSAGFILISGYHRLRAMQAKLFFQYHVEKGTWPKDELMQEPVLNMPTLKKVLAIPGTKDLREYTKEEQAYIFEHKMLCRAVTYTTLEQLKQAVMRANNSHGAQLDEKLRGKYAWIEKCTADINGLKMTYRQAGDIYGIAHTTIYDYRDSKAGVALTAQMYTRATGKEVKPEQVVRGQVYTLEQIAELNKKPAASTPTASTPTASTPTASTPTAIVTTVPATPEQLAQQEIASARDTDSSKIANASFKALRDLYAGIKGSTVDLNVVYLRSFTSKADIEMLRAMATTYNDLAKALEKDEVAKVANGKKNKGV